MSLFQRKTLLKTGFFARENQVGGSQLRSRSWGAHAAPFAWEYRGNAIGKEAFNSEALRDRNLRPASMPADENAGCSTEWDQDAGILRRRIVIGGKQDSNRRTPLFAMASHKAPFVLW